MKDELYAGNTLAMAVLLLFAGSRLEAGTIDAEALFGKVRLQGDELSLKTRRFRTGPERAAFD